MLVNTKNSNLVDGKLPPFGISKPKTVTLMLAVLDQTDGGPVPTE